MRAGAGIVSDPDTEVLDLHGPLLMDLSVKGVSARSPLIHVDVTTYHVEADNFTIGLLDFSKLHQEVPESRFGYNSVWCKNAHAVKLGCRV